MWRNSKESPCLFRRVACKPENAFGAGNIQEFSYSSQVHAVKNLPKIGLKSNISAHPLEHLVRDPARTAARSALQAGLSRRFIPCFAPFSRLAASYN
jgi:hypothetical protein